MEIRENNIKRVVSEKRIDLDGRKASAEEKATKKKNEQRNIMYILDHDRIICGLKASIILVQMKIKVKDNGC